MRSALRVAIQRAARVLAAWALVASFTGCGKAGDGAQANAMPPLEIDRSTTCELDGMLLADYPGPKAQVFFAGQSRPEFFCNTVELLSTLLRPEQVRRVRMAYVQDMGLANWDHPEGHWIDAKTSWYVLGSKRQGSMGPTIASFALEADARKFMAAQGGKLLRFAEITADMVDLSGGAARDSKM